MEHFSLLPLGAMASRLGIQPRDLREAAEAGAVPCVRLGQRGLMFDPSTVEQCLIDRAGSTPVRQDPGQCVEAEQMPRTSLVSRQGTGRG